MSHRLATLAVTVLAALAVPASARAAATLYAGPSGSGTTCQEVTPCSLATALTTAGTGDTVQLAGGSYGSAAQPLAPLPTSGATGLAVEGTPGEPMPQVFVDTGPFTGSYVYALELSGGATLRDVAITALGSSDEGVAAATLDHAQIIDKTGNAACWVTGDITDSACVALATGADALDDGGLVFSSATVNVSYSDDTFYAPNGTAAYLWPRNFTLNVSAGDTIFDGGSEDIDATGKGSGATVTFFTNYAAYGKVNPSNLIPAAVSHNTDTTAPSFVDPGTGDVHESANSSTIDTGNPTVASGNEDLGGGPRWLGATPDIGAYEFAPAPQLGPALAAHDGVTVPADAEDADTTVTLLYGPTPAFGQTETIDIGSSPAEVAAFLPVSGVAPGGTYFYEVVATNAVGVVSDAAGSYGPGSVRYASPNGSPANPCTSAAPCDLVTAVNNATSGQEVVLASGSYGSPVSPITTPLVGAHSIVIDGARPAPQLYLSTSASALRLEDFFSRLSGVDVFEEGNAGAVRIDGLLDHDLIATAGGPACDVTAFGNAPTLIADSVCLGEGATATALADEVGAATSKPGALVLDHDTVYSRGPAARADPAFFPLQVTSTDSIFDGTTDIETSAQGANGAVTFTADHSDYTTTDDTRGGAITPPGTATNISTPPLFVNAATGDLHEAPGSPTVDVGVADPFGSPTDLDGVPRAIGAGTDIGAYEQVQAPAVGAGSTTGVTQTGVTVTAEVNPNGGDTQVHVDYGTTTAYGNSTTPIDAGTAADAAAVSIPLSGLSAGTTYHLRVVAVNAAGTTDGGDVSVSTAAAAGGVGALTVTGSGTQTGSSATQTGSSATQPGSTVPVGQPHPPTTTVAPPPGTLTVAGVATVTGRSAVVAVSCGPPAPALSRGCDGTLQLTVKRQVRAHHGGRTVTKTVTLTIAGAPFSLTGGQHTTIALHLTAFVAAAVAAAKGQRFSVTLHILRTDGAVTPRIAALTLEPAAPKAKKKKK